MNLHYEIPSDDLAHAGEASSSVKRCWSAEHRPCQDQKAAVSMYEAEINAVIHGGGGSAEVTIDSDKIVIRIIDNGPGIADLELAMQEGYTTASDDIREMGFGAGMGLPNMKRYADELDIQTRPDKGTIVTIVVYFHQ